jgi:NADH-quinone oxidoreductase subunit M
VILLVTILIPLLAALAVALAPETRAKSIAMLGTSVALVLGGYLALQFPWDHAGEFHLGGETAIEWLPSLGISLSLGVDGVALLLILLTLLLGPICVAASSTAITSRRRSYYAWLLVLQAAMTGVFAARDIVVFYVCFEFTLVPMFVLISLWGSTNRKRAAVKFFLYTFTGSVLALAAIVYVAAVNAAIDPASLTSLERGLHPEAGRWSFSIDALTYAAGHLSSAEQALVMAGLMLGFAVKVPLFPFHTWLPLAHTEAPTAGSVILAGVLLKLGTYGIYRFVFAFAPMAVVEYAPLVALVCIVGILYGGLICWVQTDVKKLVAYSSVAHLGFCVLGMFALNGAGLTGSIFYMINHGLSTGALFLLIGMIYERYHTRSMKELGGLAAKMPIWSTFMVFFTMASVGLPGLNGFVSEFLCLLGAFQASSAWGSGLWGSAGAMKGATLGELGPWYALIAGVGMVIGAIYLLYMVGRIVWGKLVEPHAHHDGHDAHAPVLPKDLCTREIVLLLPLAALCIGLGVYPKPVLQALEEPVRFSLRGIDDVRAARPVAATPIEAARVEVTP